MVKWRREWDSNRCGLYDPRALKARALTTLPSGCRTKRSSIIPAQFPSTTFLVLSVLKCLSKTHGRFVRLPSHLTERLNHCFTLSSCMGAAVTVSSPSELLETILEGAKQLHPRESFLFLRGKKGKGVISVSDLVVAPFAVHGSEC